MHPSFIKHHLVFILLNIILWVIVYRRKRNLFSVSFWYIVYLHIFNMKVDIKYWDHKILFFKICLPCPFKTVLWIVACLGAVVVKSFAHLFHLFCLWKHQKYLIVKHLLFTFPWPFQSLCKSIIRSFPGMISLQCKELKALCGLYDTEETLWLWDNKFSIRNRKLVHL